MFKAQIEHLSGQEKKLVQSIHLKRGKALEIGLPYNSNITEFISDKKILRQHVRVPASGFLAYSDRF
jgi:hypothetical protein